MITLDRLEHLLAAFGRQTIALVGDLFLDRYLEIDPDLAEHSVETGLEAFQVTRVRHSPGALGTVMNNLAALGVGRLLPVTVLGDDGQAYDLLQSLAHLPVDTQGILQDPSRLTPTYTKPMRRDADGVWREWNRLDLRNRSPLAGSTIDTLLERISAAFEAADGIIVSDQVNEAGWGVVAPEVRAHLAVLCRAHPSRPVLIDSRAHIGRFRCGMLKPNLAECLAALGRRPVEQDAPDDLTAARRAALELSAHSGCRLFCTLGSRGMLAVGFGPHGRDIAGGGKVFADERAAVLVPGYLVSGPVDIVGAGDSATAGIMASLLAGASATEAAAVGNLVASITVTQIGTTGTASPAQVIARWRETHAVRANEV